MKETTEEPKTKYAAKPLFTAIFVVLIATHSTAIFLWIAPSNPVSKAVNKPLRHYVQAWFQQAWSLFAPNPISVANYLEVRAVSPDMEEEEWISASDVELQGLHHNLLPTNAVNITHEVARNTYNAIDKLPKEDSKIFSWHYHSDAWERIESEITGNNASTVGLEKALDQDRAVTAYATQFLLAKGVLSENDLVQYRITKVKVPSFNNRLTKESEETVVFTSGRRPQTVLPGQDSAGFARALERF